MTGLIRKYSVFKNFTGLVGFAIIGLSMPAFADDALVQKGKEISVQHCARCHVVGDLNPHGGISSTPSFQLMVNELSDWEIRFETFHARHPHPAIIRFKGYEYVGDPPTTVPITLELEDVDAILAFAKTLKK